MLWFKSCYDVINENPTHDSFIAAPLRQAKLEKQIISLRPQQLPLQRQLQQHQRQQQLQQQLPAKILRKIKSLLIHKFSLLSQIFAQNFLKIILITSLSWRCHLNAYSQGRLPPILRCSLKGFHRVN